MKLKPIKFIHQNVKESQLEEAIRLCFNNISFSTYPYILYKLTSSRDTLKQYNSGNCIALSLFIHTYLKNNYGFHSYIIPASVPSIFRVEGTNNICHVALCIPVNFSKFYIIDPAFYFLNPMTCSMKNNISRTIESCNIHNNENETIEYILHKSSYDAILPGSIECKCFFTHLPKDPWFYYLNEVLDPDQSIGSFYIKAKPNPFLCNTEYDESTNMVKKKYHIKSEDNEFIVIKYCKEIYRGPPDKLPHEIQEILQNKLYKYFSNYIV
jgi:hypothetical protein